MLWHIWLYKWNQIFPLTNGKVTPPLSVFNPVVKLARAEAGRKEGKLFHQQCALPDKALSSFFLEKLHRDFQPPQELPTYSQTQEAVRKGGGRKKPAP